MLLRTPIFVFVAVLLALASVASAMDWENSVVIASFPSRDTSVHDAQRLVSLLRDHKIAAVITPSAPSVISVAQRNEMAARKIMATALKKDHLRLTPVHERP